MRTCIHSNTSAAPAGRLARLLGAIAAAALLAGTVTAQDTHFDSGSDGSDGVLTVMSGQTVTLNMDDNPDGIFNFISVDIASTGILEVEANADNTPLVMLVQEDFVCNGFIDMNGTSAASLMPGLGGPGGWNGGSAGRVAGKVFLPGAGQGPGGGLPMMPTDPLDTAGAGKNTYMKPSLVPQIGGSGGGGGGAATANGGAGGGGGGALTIAVSGVFNLGGSGRIQVNGGLGAGSSGGGDVAGAGGSGGSIRIIATEINGGFELSALGANPGPFGPAFTDRRGEDGIIRLETFDISANFTSLQGVVYTSLPGLVFADGTGLGTLRISSIGGAAVPTDAGSNTAAPDVIIPAGISNPVTVQVTAENVTPGQTALIRVNYAGEGGAVIEADTTPLTGTNETSTATASINLNAGVGTMTAILSTPMTSSRGMPVQIAENGVQGRILIDGEPAVRIEQETELGSTKTQVSFVTESGKKSTFSMDR